MDARQAELKAELERLAENRRTEHAAHVAAQKRKRDTFIDGLEAMLGGDPAGAERHMRAFETDVRAGRRRTLRALSTPTGFTNGVLRFHGAPYTGCLDGVTFADGISQSGFVAVGAALYHDGRPFTGTWEGAVFADGRIVAGSSRPARFHRLSPMGEDA